MTETRMDSSPTEDQTRCDAIEQTFCSAEFDCDGYVHRANEAFRQAVGYSQEELEACGHAGLMAEGAHGEFFEKVMGEPVTKGSFELLDKDGQTIHLSGVYFTLQNAETGTRRIGFYGTDETAVVAARSKVTMICEALALSSTDLSAYADELCKAASNNDDRASTAAQAAERVNTRSHALSDATKRMSESITKISEGTAEATGVAQTAVDLAGSTHETVVELGEASKEISAVVKVIGQLASQTNLLALNATIEAARAGEEGKGFAVVAQEVKALANASASAAEDIENKIQRIQTNTLEAVGAIGKIKSITDQIRDLQTVIADAVEEQSVTSAQMHKDVEGTAGDVEEIASSIQEVAKYAKGTIEDAEGSLYAATDMKVMTDLLTAELDSI